MSFHGRNRPFQMKKPGLWDPGQGPAVSRWRLKPRAVHPWSLPTTPTACLPPAPGARSQTSDRPSGFGLHPVSISSPPWYFYLCFRDNPLVAGGMALRWLANCIGKVEEPVLQPIVPGAAPQSIQQVGGSLEETDTIQEWDSALTGYNYPLCFSIFLYLEPSSARTQVLSLPLVLKRKAHNFEVYCSSSLPWERHAERPPVCSQGVEGLGVKTTNPMSMIKWQTAGKCQVWRHWNWNQRIPGIHNFTSALFVWTHTRGWSVSVASVSFLWGSGRTVRGTLPVAGTIKKLVSRWCCDCGAFLCGSCRSAV